MVEAGYSVNTDAAAGNPTSPMPSTALVERDADNAPMLPADLVDLVHEFQEESHAESTRTAYKRGWRQFRQWCKAHRHRALPAAPETIVLWLAAMFKGPNGRPLSRSTINQALSAVIFAHREKGHTLDRGHPLIARAWRGLSRKKAETEKIRRVNAISTTDLEALWEDLMIFERCQRSITALPADARDAALLSLGWGGALRRSELVALDYLQLGTGLGFVTHDERGVTIHLQRSKASQTEGETIVVPFEDMPAATDTLVHWAKVANLKPGDPLFVSIDKGQRIGRHQGKPSGRLGDDSVALILKRRIKAMALARGKTREEADALARQYSGHSMRAGYCTAAAAAKVPGYRIQQHTRHKSAEMIARYVREADKWNNSGLRGVLYEAPAAR